VPQFAPGSFTKNLGWETDPPGLNKLHHAIRLGFGDSTGSVRRNDFRANTRGFLDANRQLIPLNFFLHNTIRARENFVTVDEFVRLALLAPHSRLFDHLAVFVLHLSVLGDRRGVAGTADQAAFFNEYVRTQVWSEGAWRRSALTEEAVESWFNANLAVSGPDTAHKCMTNYRFILSLAGYLSGGLDVVNTRAEEWATAAFWLAFDRWYQDSQRSNWGEEDLAGKCVSDELYKLMGLPESGYEYIARGAAADYLRAGGPDRPLRPAHQSATPNATVGAAQSSAWSDETNDPSVEVARRLRQLRLQVRRPGLSRALRAHYDNTCCFCGRSLIVGVNPERRYSEAAHVRAIGAPHKGPDRSDNVLVLCPEHHIQFDAGVLTLVLRDGQLRISSKIPGDPLDGQLVQLRAPHTLNPAHARYHAAFWLEP
jgi:HNH endonuclease